MSNYKTNYLLELPIELYDNIYFLRNQNYKLNVLQQIKEIPIFTDGTIFKGGARGNIETQILCERGEIPLFIDETVYKNVEVANIGKQILWWENEIKTRKLYQKNKDENSFKNSPKIDNSPIGTVIKNENGYWLMVFYNNINMWVTIDEVDYNLESGKIYSDCTDDENNHMIIWKVVKQREFWKII